ncbi:MAG: CBS domain-containing protein [Pseudomonadota bacterium]
MSNVFQSLEIKIMPVATKLSIPTQNIKSISINDYATEVMTDLHCICAITIAAGDGVSDAEYKMKMHQIKMLFVTDHNEHVIGLLTYSDISGQRLLDSEKELSIPASEMCILDIMTGIDSIDVIEYKHIDKAKVGDVVETLKQLNRQHLLVLDNDQDRQYIRGIFSSTQIGRQLNKHLDIPAKILLHEKNISGLRTA